MKSIKKTKELANLANALLEARQALREAQDRERELADYFKELLDHQAGALTIGGILISVAERSRTQLDSDALKRDLGDALEKYRSQVTYYALQVARLK